MHPLHSLANALTDRRQARRTRHILNDILADPQMAKDIGLPHQPKLLSKPTLW